MDTATARATMNHNLDELATMVQDNRVGRKVREPGSIVLGNVSLQPNHENPESSVKIHRAPFGYRFEVAVMERNANGAAIVPF
jgi:hypothetical protein